MSTKDLEKVMLQMERAHLAVGDAALVFIDRFEEEGENDLSLDPTGRILSTGEYRELRDAVKQWREAGEALAQAIRGSR